MQTDKQTVKPTKTLNFRNGDTIQIEGKRYVIAGLIGGGYTLLDASGPGWTPADFED